MNRKTVLTTIVALAGTLIAAAPMAQTAQNYPSRPIQIVVSSPTGGGVDPGARTIAGYLSSVWNNPVVVVNKTGVLVISANFVAKAPPDGYTIKVTSVSHIYAPSFYKDMPYDPVKSFEPIVLAYTVPHMLLATSSLPVRTMPELVALLKANPGKYNFSAATGTLGHLEGHLFKMMVGFDAVFTPYKQSLIAQTDLIAGRVHFAFDGVINALPQIRAGKLRPLAVTTRQRVSSIPDIPTMQEAGLKDFETGSWVSVLAPARTPSDIINKLNAEINKGLKTPEVAKQIMNTGAEIAGGTPKELGDLMVREFKIWAEVAKSAGIKPE